MHQIDNETTTPSMPPFQKAIRPGWFSNGGQAQAATYPGADWFNMVQAELLNILSAAEIAPNKDQLNQIAKAIVKLATNTATDAVDGLYLQLSENLNDIRDKDAARTALNVITKGATTGLIADALNEALSALKSHKDAADPHPQYMTSNETANVTNQAMSAHKSESDPHSQYMTGEETTNITNHAIISHKNEQDPHTQYAKTSTVDQSIAAHVNNRNAHNATQINCNVVGISASNVADALYVLAKALAQKCVYQTQFWTDLGGIKRYEVTKDKALAKLLAKNRRVEIIVAAGHGGRNRMNSAIWIVNGHASNTNYHSHMTNVAEVWMSYSKAADIPLVFTTDQLIYEIYFREMP